MMFGNSKSLDCGPSLRDESGAFSICPKCGARLIGYGDVGGYCERCGEWHVDHELTLKRLRTYSPAAETLCTIIAYDNVKMAGSTFYNIFGTLFVTPFSLLFRPESKSAAMARDGGVLRRAPEIGGRAMQSPYSDIGACIATKGSSQALTVSYKPDRGRLAAGCWFELQGRSYDKAEGTDMKRLSVLVNQFREIFNS